MGAKRIARVAMGCVVRGGLRWCEEDCEGLRRVAMVAMGCDDCDGLRWV